ncbi:MAG: SUMF1/EgtB/PvdO family nonheme iron enzyme [Nitrospira sp.]|nr:SUMF1/EgtB/PvdO family nonheme iron enzyme [Nitrospira sp.]
MADFDVFLSYHGRDQEPVGRIARALREQGLKPFLDRWSLVPGRPWPQALEEALASCQAVAVCIGPGEMGPWQQRELHQAIKRQVAGERCGQIFPVIPVLLPGAEPPLGFLSQNTWVDLRSRVDEPVLLNRLVNAIHGKPPGPDAQETVRETLAFTCPYRGLFYFREEDAPFFFGRKAAITQLVSSVLQHNLVAVVGASGSGKSSVVRAGLVPELRKSRDSVWEIATIVPTDRPFHELAAVLMPLLKPSLNETTRLVEISTLAKALRNRTIALRDIVDRVLAMQPGTDCLLLIVDQWEELFTLCEEEDTRRCFIDNILEATTKVKLHVVLTLRGDFFGRAITDYRPLSDRVQGAQVNLAPMNWDELRQVIEEPARKVSLSFEPGLVDRILEQAGEEPGNLPLIEFVLRQLWEKRRGSELHHEAYGAMGELKGAIATKADSIYDSLSQQDQRRMQQIFLRLVRLGEGEADTRRRAMKVELRHEPQDLVRTLIRERLLVTSRLADGTEETIEVSHEALVRHWSKLKGWIKAKRKLLVWQEQLNTMMRQWEADNRSADLLLRGRALWEAEDQLSKIGEDLSDDERQFITVSTNRRKRIRMARIALPTLAGFIILMFGLTYLLWGLSFDQAKRKIQSRFGSIHLEPDMQLVAAGRFQQGDIQGRGLKDEKPVREVTVKSFLIGKFEVTFDEYDRFALTTGRLLPDDQRWGRGQRPVINVSWQDAKDYAAWLSEKTGKRYRLPTESEWEYAARSEGKDDLWAGTSDEEQLNNYAVYRRRAKNPRTAPVGYDQERRPNAIGLYDMSGNVLEWVEDCMHSTYNEAPTDGTAWLETGRGDCDYRVNRGGAWSADLSVTLRVSRRFLDNLSLSHNQDLGFRLVQDLGS